MTDLMKDLSEIDRAATLAPLSQAEKGDGGVQLPFPVAYLWALNGDAKQKNAAKSCPPLYFGGLAGDSDALGELVEQGIIPGLPKGWTAYEGAGDKGSWNGLAGRTLAACFIASRTRWIGQNGESGPEYAPDKGLTRRHMQSLTFAYSDGKPWGYAVVTTKGYQVNYLTEAIAAWGKAIAPHRKALNAVGLPLSAFALTVGTQGDEPNFVSVGKAATSKITPLQAILPAELTAERVAQRFIGADRLRENAARLEQAREWLAAWKSAPAKPVDDGAEYTPDWQEIPF